MARKLLLWYQHRCETSIVVLFRSKNANSLQTISCAVLHFYAVEKKNEIEIESEFLWRCYYVPPVESWSLNLQHTLNVPSNFFMRTNECYSCHPFSFDFISCTAYTYIFQHIISASTCDRCQAMSFLIL